MCFHSEKFPSIFFYFLRLVVCSGWDVYLIKNTLLSITVIGQSGTHHELAIGILGLVVVCKIEFPLSTGEF